MKFMKLGFKPDVFQTDGKSVRYTSSELTTDITVTVGEVKFFLHKFPLLSKCNFMQKLMIRASEKNWDEVDLAEFPGGPNSFEICAKFCYEIVVTLNPYNVVAVRCAAEYLEMTEDVDRGNLVYKIEVFLNSSIFRSWKDSIIVLQTTKLLLPHADDLKIVSRCVDSIASKAHVDPARLTWSYTHNRKLSAPDQIVEDGIVRLRDKGESVPEDWWVEDVSDLDIDLYKRVLLTVKSKGRMDCSVIGEAIRTYAVRWLPDSLDNLMFDSHSWRCKNLVETLIHLLPSDKGGGCPCSFLLKLLITAMVVEADDLSKQDLVKMISLKLHEASVKDLLVPARSPSSLLYDVELVLCIVNHYAMHEKYRLELNLKKENEQFVLDHGRVASLRVGKLIDGYLSEIARDPNLTIASFVELSQSIPDSSRPVHDGLYKAIDIFLKEHAELTKTEKKKICGLMDVKKLTMEASTHAAQNDRLPLRVVVQILFFEQIRSSGGIHAIGNNNHGNVSNSTTNTEEDSERTDIDADDCRSLRKQVKEFTMNGQVSRRSGKLIRSKNGKSGVQLLPSRSRRIFGKLLGIGMGPRENRSSETSRCSQSPSSVVHGDAKSSGSSSRRRRHSIS